MKTERGTQIRLRLRLARELARQGFDIARNGQQNCQSLVKANFGEYATLVTGADQAVEKLITLKIRSVFPADGIIGEEGEENNYGDSGFAWVIDPIDGTRNFSRGLDPWAVSIAIHYRGVPVAAAICMNGKLYSTHEALPHVLVGHKPLIPLPEAPPEKRCIGYEVFDWLPNGAELASQLWKLSPAGAVTLGGIIGTCLMVLEGRLDGVVHPGLALWDIAPIVLMAEKTGAVITRWDGTPCFPHIWDEVKKDLASYMRSSARQLRFDIVCARPEAHRTLLEFTKPHASYLERMRA
ncbi:MAG: inositol monophosphatase [Patescibacteria group bacterium]